jgi:ETFB lysine methyltransferase
VTDVAASVLGAALRERFATVERVVPMANGALTLCHPENAEALISDADFERDERLPYWADVWPSARVLADALVARHPGAHGPAVRLLELGCGAGMVAAQAARLGFEVTATDYYAEALDFARWNAWVNSGREIAARVVDWRELPNDLGHFDLVVASDVLYERPYGPLVARAVRATLRRGGTALITDPGRVGAEGFLDECRSLGLVVGTLDQVTVTDGPVTHQVTLWEATRC